MHEYSVEFRMQGADLDISSTTENLELIPTLARKDQKRFRTDSELVTIWGYEAFESEKVKYWESLEEGLLFILEKLWPVRDKIEEYKPRYEVYLWCGHFHSDFGGGPRLSPEVLRKLGELGVPLYIETYVVD